MKIALHFLILTILLLLLSACTRDEAAISVDLQSDETFLEGKKVYLKDWSTRRFVDSTFVRGGKFSFDKTAHENGFPFRAGIYYETGNPAWPQRVIGIRNPLRKGYTESTIYAEPGTMKLLLDTILQRKGAEEVLFKIENLSEQTEIAFRHPEFKIASAKDFQSNKLLVQKYPGSIELLDLLRANKAAFDTMQLRELMSGFNPSLHQHPGYLSLQAYLATDIQSDGFPADCQLKLPAGHIISGLAHEAKPYQLIVFWASWCGPCRMEIPQIKKLHAINGNRLAITSISIDSDEGQWKKALAAEKMPWAQFVVHNEPSFALLDKKYDLGAIPVWILLDREGKIIKKHTGYAEAPNGIDAHVAALLK